MTATDFCALLGLLGIVVGAAFAGWSFGSSRRFAARVRHEVSLADLARQDADRERDRAERQAAQFRKAMEAMTDGIMMLDGEARLVEWNARFAIIIGVPQHVLKVGTPMAEILRAQAEAGEFGPMASDAEITAAVDERMATLDSFQGPAVVERVRPNGRVIETRRTSMPGGGFITLYSDITQRRQAQAAERNAVAAAAAAARQRQEFVAMVTHELRAPLDAISQSLGLIVDDTLPAASRGLVDIARTHTAVLLDLTGDILDMSRLEEGRLALRPADYSLRGLFTETAGLFTSQAASRDKSIVIDIPPAIVDRQHGDAGRVRQVLINLLSNAIKYSNPGVVTLGAEARDGTLHLTVTDPGPAIPPAQASALFQPFSRLRSADLGAVSGTGLGLAISARLVALMGGEIGLAATGHGNAFWFTLPIAPLREEAAHPPAMPADRPARRGVILVVEDLAPNRELTAILLRREGYRVDTAADGITAVEMSRRCLYDVVLMDIHMPGIDGITASRRIRALHPPAAQARIIALTGSSGADVDAASAGVFDGFVTKPVQPEVLMETIRRQMDTDRPAASGPVARPPALEPIDLARVAALREGLPPGVFERLLGRCIVEIRQRLPDITAPGVTPKALHEAAHALAGMAGSYGLAEFEAAMRAMMQALDGGDAVEAGRIAEGAAAVLERAEQALPAKL